MVTKFLSNASISKNKPNIVILYTFAPTTSIVNSSPFGFKLQTYLRMAGNVIPCDQEFTKPFGKNGKSPWIELNDEAAPDSSLIIEFLNEQFKV